MKVLYKAIIYYLSMASVAASIAMQCGLCFFLMLGFDVRIFHYSWELIFLEFIFFIFGIIGYVWSIKRTTEAIMK